jgi:hypothetical protein
MNFKYQKNNDYPLNIKNDYISNSETLKLKIKKKKKLLNQGQIGG